MPAVSLARLSQQIDVLVWQFTRPTDFLSKLHDLFNLYANRVYRKGQAVPPASMVPAYHVAPLVLRQLEMELRAPCKQHPIAALALVDALWAETMLESRILATTLLGNIPLHPPEPITERLRAFARPDTDTQVLDALLERGGVSLRQDQPDLWLGLIEYWANDLATASQGIALRAILVTARDERFSNHPPLFRIFSHLLQAASGAIQAELQTTLLGLLRCFPKETVFLLRQILPITGNTTTHRLVRLSLSHVPFEYQDGLRQALQAQKNAYKPGD
jgi:hypothetical protein